MSSREILFRGFSFRFTIRAREIYRFGRRDTRYAIILLLKVLRSDTLSGVRVCNKNRVLRVLQRYVVNTDAETTTGIYYTIRRDIFANGGACTSSAFIYIITSYSLNTPSIISHYTPRVNI